MKYLFILIGSSFLFTGCFTMGTLDSAKQDRKPERVKTVLTSYEDTSGNMVIIYNKRYRKSIYKAVVPLDSIISKYEVANEADFLNRDSTIENFRGVFNVSNSKNKKEKQRIILFNKETPINDTSGLYKEIVKNKHLVENYKGKTVIPVDGYVVIKESIKTRAVSFIVQSGNKGDSIKNEKFYITFQPQRHKRIKYLLVPLAVGVDAVTWPVQIVIGIIALSKVPIS